MSETNRQSHKYNHVNSKNKNKIPQKSSDIEQIEDCGALHNIEGVTYEGQGLGDYWADFDF